MVLNLEKKEHGIYIGLAMLIVLVVALLSYLVGRDIVEKKVDNTRRILKDGLGNFGVLMEVGGVVLPIVTTIGVFVYTGMLKKIIGYLQKKRDRRQKQKISQNTNVFYNIQNHDIPENTVPKQYYSRFRQALDGMSG